MKPIFHIVLIIVAAGTGFFLGIAMRGKPEANTLAAKAVSEMTNGTAAPKNKTAQTKGGSQALDNSPLATQLEIDLSMSSGVTRWLYWLDAIEKASPSDFPRLARMAEANPSIMRLIATRWVDLYPRHLFDALASGTELPPSFRSGELSQTLFREWTKRDPDAVVAALSEPNNPMAQSQRWRMEVVTAFFDNDVERGLRLMSEWRIENYSPRMNGVAKWAAANPQHAAEFALAHPAGYGSQAVMKTIGAEWAKTDPSRALHFAAAARGELGFVLAESVLKEWTRKNRAEAGLWLSASDLQTRNRLSPGFVETWAKEDVAGALEWCALNLTGSSLSQAVGGVFKGVAEKDLNRAANIVAQMQPTQARMEAAASVADKWFPDSFSNKPISPESVAWLQGLDSKSLRHVLEKVTWKWSQTDTSGFADFLAARSTEEVPSFTYLTAARNLARKNPAEALEWASKLPETQALSAGSEAFTEWRRSQPEIAAKWLEQLPPSDSRKEPYFERVVHELAHDPLGTEQLARLGGNERTTAKKVIEKMPLPPDRRSRLLEILQ